MKLNKHTKTLLLDPIQRRAWIIFQMTSRGRTLSELARENGVKRQTLYTVFRRSYPRMECLIAHELRLKPQELWPERYDRDGISLSTRGRPPREKKHPRK